MNLIKHRHSKLNITLNDDPVYDSIKITKDSPFYMSQLKYYLNFLGGNDYTNRMLNNIIKYPVVIGCINGYPVKLFYIRNKRINKGFYKESFLKKYNWPFEFLIMYHIPEWPEDYKEYIYKHSRTTDNF